MDLHQFTLSNNFTGFSPNTSGSVTIKYSHQNWHWRHCWWQLFWESVDWLNSHLFSANTGAHNTSVVLVTAVLHRPPSSLTSLQGALVLRQLEIFQLSVKSVCFHVPAIGWDFQKYHRTTFNIHFLRKVPIILFEDSQNWRRIQKREKVQHIFTSHNSKVNLAERYQPLKNH